MAKNSSLSLLGNRRVHDSLLRSLVVEFLVLLDLHLLVEAILRVAVGQVEEVLRRHLVQDLQGRDSDKSIDLVVKELLHPSLRSA